MSKKSVLFEIVEKRRRSAAQIDTQLLPERSRARYSLRTALAQQDFPNLILECKAASPSKGQLAVDYDPAQLARTYQRFGAKAISVLVESAYFRGSYEHLQAVTQAVDLPVLCKDFIVSRAQIAAANAYGADVVLLMLQVLSDEEYRDLADYAHSLGLQVLTEVSTVEECERATALGASIIDVNHRDLHTLEINLNRCRELRRYLPKEALVVAASGLSEARELKGLAQCCDGFLVGSSLSGAPDLTMALRKLIYGNIKICGIKSSQTAKLAAEAGASYGGLIWHKSSPRCVDPVSSAQIVADQQGALKMLVVTTESATEKLAEVGRLAADIGCWGIQLHTSPQKDELAFVSAARKVVPSSLALVRAVSSQISGENLRRLVSCEELAWVIVDSKQPGSGCTWDWTQIPADLIGKLWVAGGIGPENVVSTVAAGFSGFDINSGVEQKTAGGPIKDPQLIDKTCRNIRQAR